LKQNKAANKSLRSTFEIRGDWFLPDSKHIVAGTLVRNEENSYLELFGKLNPNKTINMNMQSPEIIWGRSINGEEFTIIGPFLKNVRESIGGYQIASEKYLVPQFIVGKHIYNVDNYTFESMKFEFTYLSQWLGEALIHMNNTEVENKLIQHQIIYTPPEDFEIEITSIDSTLKNAGYAKSNTDYFNKGEVSVFSALKITPKKEMTFSWYQEQLDAMQKLYTLLSGHSVYVENVIFYEKEELLEIHEEEYKFKNSCRWFYKQNEVKIKSIRSEDFIVTFNDIRNNFSQVINNWFEKQEKMDVVFNLFIDDFYQKTHITTSFINIMQAIEAFHRRNYEGKIIDAEQYKQLENQLKEFISQNAPADLINKLQGSLQHGNEFTLKNRLIELIDNISADSKQLIFGESTSNQKINKFLQKLVSTRNYFTHYDEKGKKNIIESDKRFFAIKRLNALLTILLFKDLGVEEHVILSKIQENNQFKNFLSQANNIFN